MHSNVHVGCDVPVVSRREWMPAPVAENEEEFARASMKYGLLPEDYGEYGTFEGHVGRGDYPQMPMHSGDERTPWHAWDDEAYRLNYGETVFPHYNLFYPEMLNENLKEDRPDASWPRVWWYFCGPMIVLGIIVYGNKYFGPRVYSKRRVLVPEMEAGLPFYKFDRKTGPPLSKFLH